MEARYIRVRKPRSGRRRQIRADAGAVEAHALAGAAAFDIRGVVLDKDRVVVEPAEAARPQKMGEPAAAQLQLGTGHGVAACHHDEGRLLLPNVTRLRNPEHRELYLSGPRLAAGEPK